MSEAELTVTLPPDVADMVESHLVSGHYASAGDVIRDGSQALQERDGALERWLREEVLPGHAEYVADPATAIAAEDLLGRLKQRRGA